MIELIDYPLSERSYPVRLLMSQLGIENFTTIEEGFVTQNGVSNEIMKISPLGDFPILLDGDKKVWSSNACLIYLASKYDANDSWYPQDPDTLANLHEWLIIASELSDSIGKLREHEIFLRDDVNINEKKKLAYSLLKKIETQLWKNNLTNKVWLVDNQPTIADLACFSYIIFSDQASISLMDFPYIKKWCKQIHNLPNFSEIPGIYS